jgi:hypothetical protein
MIDFESNVTEGASRDAKSGLPPSCEIATATLVAL